MSAKAASSYTSPFLTKKFTLPAKYYKGLSNYSIVLLYVKMEVSIESTILDCKSLWSNKNVRDLTSF